MGRTLLERIDEATHQLRGSNAALPGEGGPRDLRLAGERFDGPGLRRSVVNRGEGGSHDRVSGYAVPSGQCSLGQCEPIS